MTEAHTLDTLDPGHLLSIADWEAVVQEAEAIARGAAIRMPRGLGRSSFASVTGFVQSRWGGGQQTARFGVLHDAETPLANGYGLSIANMFAKTAQQKSAHFMVDPSSTYQLRDTNLLAWHCGNGNRYSIGVEQAGYAAFTRAQWLSELGIQQINRLAALWRDIQRAHGIGMYWMDDTTLLRAYRGEIIGGWATHSQCRRVLKGTTHTDPDPNYPYDELANRANGGSLPTPVPPAPVPSGAPEVLRWDLPRGNYYGNIAGPATSRGGATDAERKFVKNIQAWFIYKGCVPGVTNWQTSGWDDGKWEDATDAACIRWHAKFYPGQPKPKQVWADDYARLARA